MMQATCPVCRHSQRESIDEGLRAGQTVGALVAQYGVHPVALRRHRRLCPSSAPTRQGTSNVAP
jgi:hypothetical protein